MNVEVLYKNHYRELYCVAFQLVQCRAGSEDLVQETFVRLIKEHSKGVPILFPRAWLYKVLLNLSKTRISAGKNHSEKLQSNVIADIADDDIHQQMSDNEQQQIVMCELNLLPERDRNILILYQRGLTYHEIAQALEMNVTSVGTTLARAIEKLRSNLKKNHHELFE